MEVVVATYGSAILISAAAVLLGRAICVLSGHDGSTWLAAAVGFAALMIVCEVAISLPGRGWTAVVVVVLLCAASVWICGRRGADWPRLLDALPIALVVGFATAIPFLANGRIGVLGISFLNDTHWHLILAEGLRRPSIKPLDGYGPGYPLGPHAVAAVFAQGLSSDVDKTLNGVLIATPILTGLAALGLITDLSRWRRWLVAVLAAIPYLAAASYAESAFKEPILSLLLLGLVVALQEARRQRFTRPAAAVVPAAVLIAGVLYAYSYPGLIWPVAILVCWLGLELVVGGGWRRLRGVTRWLGDAAPALAIGILVFLVLVAPEIGRIRTFYLANGGTSIGTVGGVTKNALANLAHPIPTLEGVNIWLTGDFRFSPGNTLLAGALAGFAVVVLVFALVSALERRELAWPGAVLGLGLTYAYIKHSQSPYIASKALATAGPLLAVGSGGELMRRLDPRVNWRSSATLATAAAAVVFFVLAFGSSFLVLRDAQVGPVDHTNELRSLRPLLHDRPTLVLFYDDYVQWELLGVPVSSPLLGSPIPAPISPTKPWAYGQPIDFDSVSAATLDRFAYVITTRTTAQSEPPANFRPVGGSRSFEVWQRVGPTRPRLVLAESGRAGAILDCRTPSGLHISRQRGFARIRPAPRFTNVAPLVPGQSERVLLNLPAGTWDLSLPFVSPQAVTVLGGGLDVRLPPNLDRAGEIWPVGRIVSAGAPVTLTVTMSDPAFGPFRNPHQFFAPEPMVAVRAAPARTVPLRAACGRYVDWYVLS